MKNVGQNNENAAQEIIIKFNEVPMIITFHGKKGVKKYVLKTNKDKTNLLLNKKEY